MFSLTPLQQQIIQQEAIDHPDAEVCGLILKDGSVLSIPNSHPEPATQFQIATKEFIAYEPLVAAIYHSHITDIENFTPTDVRLFYSHRLPLVLYSVTRNSFSVGDPSGEQPLEGRRFCYGINDCYSLVADYYWQTFGIKLGTYPRGTKDLERVPDWEREDWDWIDRQIEAEGFVRVSDEIRDHDVIGMSLGANCRGVNHLGVYLGGELFLHQLANHKSRRERWGHPWQGYTVKVLRHRSML